MLDSDLMVTGDNPRFLEKTSELIADYFLIDLEESVSMNNKYKAHNNQQMGSRNFFGINTTKNNFIEIGDDCGQGCPMALDFALGPS